MKFDIVVAHYKENIGWINFLKHEKIRRIFVYTKSDQDPGVFGLPNVSHTYLPNIGRESHTYIWHAVNNYEQIASGEFSDFTFFVQGSPHAMNPISINKWIEIVSESRLNYTYNFKVGSPYEFLDRGRCSHWAGETKPASGDVREWCEKNVRSGADFMIPIFWNACFGVTTSFMALSPKSRYVNIMQNELSSLNPECGHYCERLWYYIFNMDQSESKMPKDSYSFWGGPNGRIHYGTVMLEPGGTIGMYSHDNESFWSSDGESITLYDKSRKPTCILKKTAEGEYEGPFLGLGATNTIHKLIRISKNPPPQEIQYVANS